MAAITYVEIENFKNFKNKVRIELANPSVLIGPNNAGKTTVIQALSLWSRAVREWFDKKGDLQSKSKIRYGVGINRLNILDIPVRESRFYWNDTRVREGSKQINFTIGVGLVMRGKEYSLNMVFNCRDQESVYCRPDEKSLTNSALLEYACNISFHLLYPMSGIAAGAMDQSAEFLINDGQMNVQLGQGQTSHVLRNLCYRVAQASGEDWQELCNFMDVLFQVKMSPPVLDEARSILSMNYTSEGSKAALEIALGGRGMQQVLLMLAYLYTHKGAVLMIDEPDAHLEILRQRQIFSILRDVTQKTGSQIIIATHSEVILDEALDTNLSFILNGESMCISQNKIIKSTLRNLGVEHYYKARISPHLLIVEGSTDIAMLRALAQKISHPVLKYLDKRLFCYYTRNVNPEFDIYKDVQRKATPAEKYKEYFFTLKSLVPHLNALVLLDSDRRDVVSAGDEETNGMRTLYWKRYELDNYFISPETLVKYIQFQKGEDLFSVINAKFMKEAVDEVLAEMLYEGNADAVQEYYNAGPQTRTQLLAKIKMSRFAELAFEKYAKKQGQPVLLNKGDYYKIIDILAPNEVPAEITEKLDAIQKLFETETEK